MINIDYFVETNFRVFTWFTNMAIFDKITEFTLMLKQV